MGASVGVDVARFHRVLQALLPGHQVRVALQDSEWWSGPQAHLTVLLSGDTGEFPCRIGVVADWRPGVDQEVWLSSLARELSVRLSCRVIFDGERYATVPSPRLWLIWDRGTAFLADDTGSRFLGDGDGPVTIIGTIPEDELVCLDVEALREGVRD